MNDPSTRTSGVAVRLCFALLWMLVLAAPAQASGDLNIFPDPPKLIILIIAFTLLVFPLNALIFRPMFRVLDERDNKIAGATQEAERLAAQASELTAQYRASIRGAREDADAGRKQQLDAARSEQGSITGAARDEAEDEINRAREEIQVSLGEARASLQATSRDLAKVAAERILGRPLS